MSTIAKKKRQTKSKATTGLGAEHGTATLRRVFFTCYGHQAFWVWGRLPKSRKCRVVAMCKTPRQAIALLAAGFPGVDELWVTFIDPMSEMDWAAWTGWNYDRSVGIMLEEIGGRLVEK